jgi:outer membrane phospholipase A
MKSTWCLLATCVFLLSCATEPAQATALPTVALPAYLDNLIAGPGTQPSTQPLLQPETTTERSISEFLGHFSAYEPIYIVAGAVDPLAKFEFSFKFRLLNEGSPLAEKFPILGGLHFSYSQISLWQLDKASAPFYDSSYKPEFFYSNEDIRKIKIPGVSELGLQTGFGHESNGQGGATSRSMNILFIRPIFVFGDPEAFHFYVAPKAFVYVGSLRDNPDISKYRGYCDLRAVVGWRQGLEFSVLGRLGSDYNRGSVQLDLTYPIRDLLNNNLDLYIDAQYFYGYGESLLAYNKRSQAFRIGFALAR